MVIAQEPTQSLAALHRPLAADVGITREQKDVALSQFSSARSTSYSMNPVSLWPYRRVRAMRKASRIGVFPALFGPMNTVVPLTRSLPRVWTESFQYEGA